MKNFVDIKDISSYMYKTISKETPVSIVSNKDLAVKIICQLLENDNTELEFASVNFDYDKEYIVSLYYEGNESYTLSIEEAYDYETDSYFSVDGIVLFHEDVNSKALISMKSNKNTSIKYDWFTIGEEENKDCKLSCSEKDTNNTTISKKYFINGKAVPEKEYKNIKKDILSLIDFIDEMKKFDRLLRW